MLLINVVDKSCGMLRMLLTGAVAVYLDVTEISRTGDQSKYLSTYIYNTALHSRHIYIHTCVIATIKVKEKWFILVVVQLLLAIY